MKPSPRFPAGHIVHNNTPGSRIGGGRRKAVARIHNPLIADGMDARSKVNAGGIRVLAEIPVHGKDRIGKVEDLAWDT